MALAAWQGMLPTHPIPCPHCGRTLYHAVSLEGGVDAGAPECPKVEHDAGGDFMKCPHCEGRVAMQHLIRGQAEAWRVAGPA
jgi:sarcosine oxidase delta subunit